MTTVLVLLLAWGGVALLAAAIFALGAGAGHRRGYEEGRRDSRGEGPAPRRITLPDLSEVRRRR